MIRTTFHSVIGTKELPFSDNSDVIIHISFSKRQQTIDARMYLDFMLKDLFPHDKRQIFT